MLTISSCYGFLLSETMVRQDFKDNKFMGSRNQRNITRYLVCKGEGHKSADFQSRASTFQNQLNYFCESYRYKCQSVRHELRNARIHRRLPYRTTTIRRMRYWWYLDPDSTSRIHDARVTEDSEKAY